MSSNRGTTPTSAVLRSGEKIVGPMLIPDAQPDEFIDEFNVTYRSLGLSVQRWPAPCETCEE